MAFGFGLGLTRGGGAGGLIPTFNANLLNGSLPQGATFSRGTVATQYNSSGLLQYAPSNLLLQSQALNLSPWITQTNVTLTSTNTGVAPDGTLTASLWTFSGTSNNSLYQGYNTAVNQTLTGSVYLKGQAGQTISVSWQPFSGSAVFTVWTLTGNWDRVSATATNGSTAGSGNFAISVTAGQTATAVYVWGAQLEQGPNATTYTPTTTAAVYGPRFDYDPGNVLQQNLLSYSVWPGTGGPGTYPTGWGYTGSNPTACSVAQGVVNGVSTGIVSYRRVGAAGYEGLQPSINIPQNYAPASTLTVSVWARIPAGVTATDLAYYDGSNVAVIATAATLAAAGTTWTFYSKTFTAAITSTLPGSFISNNPAAGIGSGFDIAQPQLNYGPSALPYLATTSTPQTVCAPKGLLIEEARTNTVLWSTAVGGTNGWIQTGATTAVNSSTAPDGTTTASLISEDTSVSAQHAVYGATTVSASTAIALTCYIKASGRSYAYIQYNDNTSANDAWTSFSLTTGAVVTAPTILGGTFTNMASSAVNVGNGWFRVIFTLTTNTVANGTFYIGSSPDGVQRLFTGSGAAAIYVWGAQCEIGAFPTSYIPTTSAAVGRGADICSAPVPPSFNTAQGTFVAIFDTVIGQTLPPRVIGGAPSSKAPIQFNVSTPSTYDGTAVNIGASGSVVTGVVLKAAAAFNGTALSGTINGVTPLSGTGSAGFGNLTTIGFGLDPTANNNFLNGHIQSFSYYNYAMTNAQLQALTYAQYILLENGNRILLENNSGDILLG